MRRAACGGLQAVLAAAALRGGLAVNAQGRQTAQVKPDGGVFGLQPTDRGGAALLRREAQEAPEHRKGIHARVMAELMGGEEDRADDASAGAASAEASAEEDDRNDDTVGDDLEDIRRRALGGRGGGDSLAAKVEANVSNGTFDCNGTSSADIIQSWSSFKKTYCCQMKNVGCMSWSQLANGYCSPTGTSVNATYNFGSGQGKEGCKDECDQTSTCNFAIYNADSGVCSMSIHEVAPTECTNETKYWSFWKPPSQAAPALPQGATTPTTTPFKDEDAPVFPAPSSTLPLFFATTATPYRPPDADKGGWKLERVPDATVPDYAGKPPSGKPGAIDPDGGRGSPYTGLAHDTGSAAPEEPPSTSPDVLEAEPVGAGQWAQPANDMGPVAPEGGQESTTAPAEPPTGAAEAPAARARSAPNFVASGRAPWRSPGRPAGPRVAVR